ncbi:exonuclease SbcCD subunit D [Methylocella sp.]|uniref:exonuclease SbcCD subunit D n=1 Tax=Methylocella sp. TaxID=1978226 RepID=UPI003784E393
MRFRFIHAADLHLDSPLLGLSARSPEVAARIADASRQAFDNLIALCLDERCRLMVIAGDVFDGDWRDWRTGQFFVSRMLRLREAGVRVVMILGNHDATNGFMSRLELSDNVTLLSSRRPETKRFDDIGAAVHGLSFPRREVTENVALGYPAPLPGLFNIGLLHTAATGREGHVSYAPCTVEQLANHGYQYWALGHIHAREVLCASPPILFSGNLQGRSVRETGAKGATLVEVEGGEVLRFEHRPLDVARFETRTLALDGVETRDALMEAVRLCAESALDAAEGRALALRLALAGRTPLHGELAAGFALLREEVETLFAALSSDLWLEKLALRTEPPAAPASAPGVDPSVAGGLREAIAELCADGWLDARLEERLAKIRPKLPPHAHAEAFLAAARLDAPARARALALALVEEGQG